MTRNAFQIKTDGTTAVLDLDGPKGSYQTLNEGVGGWIECVALNGCDMYVNEEGKINGLPFNQIATAIWEARYGRTDIIVGDVVIVGPVDDEGDSTGLTDQQIGALQQTVRLALL